LKLFFFRKARTSIRLMLDETCHDYTYYRDKGWFESDYFYPSRLGLFKKAFGSVVDHTASRNARK